MAQFEVEITFDYGDRHWQNRWDVDAADIATVLDGADFFKNRHKAMLLGLYTLARMVVRPPASRGEFFEVVWNIPGDRGFSGLDPLPLFNTVFTALETAAGGLPGKKFFRGLLLASDLEPSGLLNPSIQTLVNTQVGGLIADLAGIGVTIALSNDKVVTFPSTQASVQMRQLHRKRKKPVI